MGYPHRRFSLLRSGVARPGEPQLDDMDVSIVVPFLDAAAPLPACLEMDGVATSLRKVFTYGRSMQSSRRVIAVQRLTMGDRPAVFRRTVQNKCYGFLRASTLLIFLALGLWA